MEGWTLKKLLVVLALAGSLLLVGCKEGESGDDGVADKPGLQQGNEPGLWKGEE